MNVCIINLLDRYDLDSITAEWNLEEDGTKSILMRIPNGENMAIFKMSPAQMYSLAMIMGMCVMSATEEEKDESENIIRFERSFFGDQAV